ncbi:MAG: anhydro-N-acetylmuramic acid kinase [Alphaproteobacteria bacterium]
MTQGHSKEIVLGFMSGTSLDGVDAALIETDGVAHVKIGPSASQPYSDEARKVLRTAVDAALADPAACLGAKAREAANVVTQAHIVLGNQLINSAGQEWQPSLVGFHGQTVLHRPAERFTCQIGDGAALAAGLDLPVVFDFRSADVAAGGQGAPLAPLYHAALVASAGLGDGSIGILNLGGVANITILQSADVISSQRWEDICAFDTGPANGLLDDWIERHGAGRFDEGGKIAANGQVNHAALEAMMEHSYFSTPAPKSLDRFDFSISPVEQLSLADGAATLTAFTAKSIAAGFELVGARPKQIIATGGGRLNDTMGQMIEQMTGCPVVRAEVLGWDGDALEAQAFAYLAKRAKEKMPLSVPGTTGAPEPICGGITVA